MIEGLDEWEAEEAKRREESFEKNKKKYDAVVLRDSLKVGGIMTQEEMDAEALENQEEENDEE